jgi:hypothetical protein
MTTRDFDRIRFVTRHFRDLQGLRTLVPLGLLLVAYGTMDSFPLWPVLLLMEVMFLISIGMRKRLGTYYQRTFGAVEQLPPLAGAQPSPLSLYRPAVPVPSAVDLRPTSPYPRLLIAVGVASVLLLSLWLIAPSRILGVSIRGWNPWFPHTPLTVASGSLTGTSGPWLTSALAELAYLVCGGAFVGLWFWRGRRLSQSYHLVLGALLLGIAALGAGLGLVLPVLWNLGIARLANGFLPLVAHFSLAEIVCGTALVIAGLLDHLQIARVLRPALEEPA